MSAGNGDSEVRPEAPAKVRPRTLTLLTAVLPVTNAVLLLVLFAMLIFGTWSTGSDVVTFVRYGLGVALLLAIFAILVAFQPRWLVERRVRTLGGTLRPAERVEAENDVRMALLQAISGVLLALGFLITWVQLGQAQKQFNTSQEKTQQQLEQNGTQLSIARTGQLADRFSRAMEQLGNSSPDVRIGGIYALEGLLVDLGEEPTANAQLNAYQKADRRAIIEILTAYVRNHAGWDPGSAPQSGGATPDLGARAADLQAVLSILGRRAQAIPEAALFLARTNLSGLRLTCPAPDDASCAVLDRLYQSIWYGVDFTECDLERADLFGASLTHATFNSSRLVKARLGSARLAYASFLGADLTDADFNGADLDNGKLQGAKLTGSTMDQTDLGHAQLQGAQLGGVDLSTVKNLDTADLHGAHANTSTKWPAGFDVGRAGVVLD
jgi:uncharacterized protein YjbI with pentapeptide repeats